MYIRGCAAGIDTQYTCIYMYIYMYMCTYIVYHVYVYVYIYTVPHSYVYVYIYTVPCVATEPYPSHKQRWYLQTGRGGCVCVCVCVGVCECVCFVLSVSPLLRADRNGGSLQLRK